MEVNELRQQEVEAYLACADALDVLVRLGSFTTDETELLKGLIATATARSCSRAPFISLPRIGSVDLQPGEHPNSNVYANFERTNTQPTHDFHEDDPEDAWSDPYAKPGVIRAETIMGI